MLAPVIPEVKNSIIFSLTLNRSYFKGYGHLNLLLKEPYHIFSVQVYF
jgi:hypothetical protein